VIQPEVEPTVISPMLYYYCYQARREPQRGPGKHSRGAQTFLCGPSAEKISEFFFKMVHSGVLYISE